MKIYVIYHATYENTNAFYLTREAAEGAIRRAVAKELADDDPDDEGILVEEFDEEKKNWHIKEIEEGENFDADFNV